MLYKVFNVYLYFGMENPDQSLAGGHEKRLENLDFHQDFRFGASVFLKINLFGLLFTGNHIVAC